MNYSEEIKKARETKKGIARKFQENANYKLSTKGKFDCPHCGAYHGYKINDNEPDYNSIVEIMDKYEIPSDIEYMCNNAGYSWIEDCKCANCGEMYSRNNGC